MNAAVSISFVVFEKKDFYSLFYFCDFIFLFYLLLLIAIATFGHVKYLQYTFYTEPRTAHESVAPEDTGHASTAHHQEVSEKRGDGERRSLQNQGRLAAGRTAVTTAGEHLSQRI